MTTEEPRPEPLQRVPLAPPVFAPPLVADEPAVPLPAPVPPTGAPLDHQPRKRRSALIALAIACSVLLLSTIGLGITTLLLLRGGSAITLAPSPGPTSTTIDSDSGAATATVQGYPVTVMSDLRVDHFTLASDTRVSTLYALVTNTNSNQVAQASFDITAYDADGRVIYRTLDLFYLLPGQTTVMDASFLAALNDLDHVAVEQTRIDWIDPTISGGADIVEARTGESYVEADLTSTLSASAEYTEVYLVVFVEDEIVGICYDLLDFPASGNALTVSCGLEEAYDEDQVDLDDLPTDTEVDVFLKIDYTFGE